MTSHPPDKCCFVVFKHEGEAQGNMEELGGHHCYVSLPPDRSTKFAIVIFPDFMGYELINTKLIADRFAANGFLTVIPDLWEGDNVPSNWNPSSSFDLQEWHKRHGTERVGPIAEATVRAMREKYQVEKLGGVGYCLGAKYVCRFLANGKGLDAGYFAHPSLVTPEEIKAIAGPLTIAAAETDELFPAEKRHETEAILKGMDIRYQLNLYSDVNHGFAIKANPRQPTTKFATETAFLQAVNWFDHFLKTSTSVAAA